MSKEAVQTVIGRAVTDAAFRQVLFAEPEKALTGYDLSRDEIAALQALDAEEMAAFAGSLEARISKSMFSTMSPPGEGATPMGQISDI